MVQGWIMLALYLGGVGLYVWLDARVTQQRHDMSAMLDEVRRCNDEFGEAIALLRYGALDEAEEVATRWREREALNLKAAQACGRKLHRVGSLTVKRGGA